jgi:hypothetical protein
MKKMMLLATLIAVVALMMAAAPAMAKDKHHNDRHDFADNNFCDFHFCGVDNRFDDDFLVSPLFFNGFEDNDFEFENNSCWRWNNCGFNHFNDFGFENNSCFNFPFCNDFGDESHGAVSGGTIIINRD